MPSDEMASAEMYDCVHPICMQSIIRLLGVFFEHRRSPVLPPTDESPTFGETPNHACADRSSEGRRVRSEKLVGPWLVGARFEAGGVPS